MPPHIDDLLRRLDVLVDGLREHVRELREELTAGSASDNQAAERDGDGSER